MSAHKETTRPYFFCRVHAVDVQKGEGAGVGEERFRLLGGAGVEIIWDIPVEFSCVTGSDMIARFLVWWPQGSERLHILTPTRLVHGRA